MANKTIVVIDDDEDMLRFYRALLADLGEVCTYDSLREARTNFTGADLFLLDFYLEKDQNLIQETVPELKAIAPVLLCSGVQDERIPEFCLQLGAAGYWNKGSPHDVLRDKVKALLGR
jgi:DNA-binding NtrC family response regulator